VLLSTSAIAEDDESDELTPRPDDGFETVLEIRLRQRVRELHVGLVGDAGEETSNERQRLARVARFAGSPERRGGPTSKSPLAARKLLAAVRSIARCTPL
jgi:hypothetical protein